MVFTAIAEDTDDAYNDAAMSANLAYAWWILARVRRM